VLARERPQVPLGLGAKFVVHPQVIVHASSAIKNGCSP